MLKYVLVVGGLGYGFVFYGPFDSQAEASKYYNESLEPIGIYGDWHVYPMRFPILNPERWGPNGL